MPQSLPVPAGPTARPGAGLIAPAVLAVAFVVLAVLVGQRWAPLMDFDHERVVELQRVDGHSTSFLDAMRVVSAVVSTAGWLLVLGLVALGLARRGQWRTVAFVAVAQIGSPVLNAALKDLIRRPRPVLAHPVAVAGGWSFPSGHTQAATVGCAVLLIVVRPRLSRSASMAAVATATVVVAVVALSRMSLGVHYPSDVVGSVLGGLAWTLGVARIVLGRGPSRP